MFLLFRLRGLSNAHNEVQGRSHALFLSFGIVNGIWDTAGFTSSGPRVLPAYCSWFLYPKSTQNPLDRLGFPPLHLHRAVPYSSLIVRQLDCASDSAVYSSHNWELGEQTARHIHRCLSRVYNSACPLKSRGSNQHFVSNEKQRKLKKEDLFLK